jgi:hypothetical protein
MSHRACTPPNLSQRPMLLRSLPPEQYMSSPSLPLMWHVPWL